MQSETEAALRYSEARTKAILEAAADAIITIDENGVIESVNPAAERLFGYTAVEAIGQNIRLIMPKRYQSGHDSRLRHYVRTGHARIMGRTVEVEGVRKDGRVFPMELSIGEARMGERRIFAGVMRDISERKRAEAERAHLATIVETSADAIFSSDLDDRIQSWNAAAAQIYGYSAVEILGCPASLFLPEGAKDERARLIDRLHRGESVIAYETTRVRKSGEPFHAAITLSPIRDGRGDLIGVSTIARDITERKRTEEHLRLLLGELSHRVKNTLAIVQAIARQTLRAAPTPDVFVEAFSARLRALSQTHNLLSERNWEGADLRDVVRAEVAPYLAAEGRIEMTGPAVLLSPRITLSLGLALHELVTNAVKYGALSIPEGRVGVAWELCRNGAEPRLHLRWTEMSGPPVAPPSRRGFGSVLIERIVGHDLRGGVGLDFAPAGLHCTMEVPLAEAEG